MKTDATSWFTQKIAESLGMYPIKEVRYADYKDKDGKQIYKTESPHDFYKVMVKEISKKVQT